MTFDITYEGRTTLAVDRAGAEALGYPEAAIAAAEARAASLHAREQARGRITLSAGDTQTLLGSTADTAALALILAAAHLAALREAGSYSAYKTALTAQLDAIDAGLAAALTGLLAGVNDASVKLPPLTKGLEEVMGEIKTRATAVAEVFET